MLGCLQLCMVSASSSTNQLKRAILMLAVITSVLVLAGCATFDPQQVAAQTRGKTFAVATTFGSELELKWIGTTIFNNEQGMVPVPDWKLNDLVVNAASSALQSTQRYPSVSLFNNISRVGDKVPILPSGTQADFLLLIEPWHGGDPMFGTNQSFKGIGVAKRSFMGMESPTRAYVSLNAELFDLSAGKSVAALSPFEHWQTTAKMTSGGSINWKEDKIPVPKIDEHDLAELKQPVVDRLTKILETTLAGMGLR